jgi:CheY-like chemotaxis protein
MGTRERPWRADSGLVAGSDRSWPNAVRRRKLATFPIHLPVLAPAAMSQATVLVVEDHQEVRVMMARTLRGEGYRVLEASDGLGALELLAREADVGLVVTDVAMPGMDGLELATRLAGRPNTGVLFTTGYASTQIPSPFILKPFTPSALSSEVHRLLPLE